MKKKIIISLILTMCCVIAYIPASATVTPTALICNPCTYLPYCWDVIESYPDSHQAYDGDSYYVCTFTAYRAATIYKCTQCGENRGTFNPYTDWHSHGGLGHDNPRYCGSANIRICAVDGFVYD